MRKIFILLGLLTLLLFTLMGCSENVYEDYLKSIEKTNNIETARQEIDFKMTMDFDTTGLSEEDAEGFNLASNFEFLGSLKYNNNENAFENNIYFKMGSIGFDIGVYGKDDDIVVELVNLGKYFKIDTQSTDDTFGQFSISDETIANINAIWQEYIHENNIFKGENILIETPSGVVKSKKYSVQLGDEASLFIQDVLNIINDDTSIDWQSDKDFTFHISKAKIEYFTFESYVDVDGYIVKDNMTFKATYDDKHFKGFDFSMNTLLHDIGKEQEISFPNVSESNLMSIDQLSDESPELFQIIK